MTVCVSISFHGVFVRFLHCHWKSLLVSGVVFCGKFNNQIPCRKIVSFVTFFTANDQLEAMARKGRIGTMVDEHGEGGGDIVVLGLRGLTSSVECCNR